MRSNTLNPEEHIKPTFITLVMKLRLWRVKKKGEGET
jgi:hypothetical protein